MTDWGAANDRPRGVASGLDLEMPSSAGINDALVLKAVNAGTLAEEDLDRAIERNVSISLLGKDLEERPAVCDQDAHHELARRVAAETAVLLKNDGLLPIAAGTTVAIVGAFARQPRYQGTGSSQVNPTRLDTLYDALGDLLEGTPTYAAGYDPVTSTADQGLIDEAVARAREAEVVVLCAGLPNIYESEGFDREHINLPPQHDDLIAAVTAANPNTVVVLSNGAPVAVPWAHAPKAIIEGHLAGQAGGSGMAELLVGLRNPCGKLAETFPLALADVPAQAWFPGEHRQVQYREGLNIGYRYFDTVARDVLFPFGHGLSYTTFEYANATTSAETFAAGDPFSVSLSVTNTGELPGAEIIQLYVSHPGSAIARPAQELRGFHKVTLGPGETQRITLELRDRAFAYFDPETNDWALEAGTYELRLAASSRDVRLVTQVRVASEDKPSAHARGMPQAPSGPFGVSDEAFAAMLGGSIPPLQPARPFHLNSSVHEVGQTLLGARVKARVVEQFTRSMGAVDAGDETLKKMFEEMANNMPLRALALFSGGRMSFDQLHMTIALLNHRYFEACRLWLRIRQNRSHK